MPDDVPDRPRQEIFRLPRTAYLVVVFLLFGAIALAFGSDASQSLTSKVTADSTNGVHLTWRLAFLALPVLAAAFIARTATVVDGDGVRVRAVLGSRSLPWASVRGLSIAKRGIYAVTDAGSVRLPCVGVAQLSRLARASEGRLPAIADPTPKYAPQRRRRR